MTELIHVSVAWPYANGDLHIGHLAGAYLPPDIFELRLPAGVSSELGGTGS